MATGAPTTKDKLRRLAVALFVTLCVVGLVVAANATREVDDNGDVIADRDDPADVEISGDDDLVAQQPPDVANEGPAQADIVQQTFPADGAEILRQQQIGIDLGNSYRVSRLLVDRTVIAEEDLVRRDELNQVFFQPGDGAAVEEFPPGRVCAVADIVEVLSGEPVRSVEWCFEVT